MVIERLAFLSIIFHQVICNDRLLLSMQTTCKHTDKYPERFPQYKASLCTNGGVKGTAVCHLCTYCPTGYQRCLVVKNILLSSSIVGPSLSFSTSLLRWAFKTWSWLSTDLVRGSGRSMGCKDLRS